MKQKDLASQFTSCCVVEVSTISVYKPVASVSISVPSTIRPALFNSMVSFSTAESIIFGIVDCAIRNLKIIACVMGKLSISLGRARRVMLRALVETLGKHLYTNMRKLYPNMVLISLAPFYGRIEPKNLSPHCTECANATEKKTSDSPALVSSTTLKFDLAALGLLFSYVNHCFRDCKLSLN